MQNDIPSSHRINEITHPTSALIPQKFSFFADCLSIVAHKSGEHFYFETETHLSLINTLQYFVDAEIRNNNSLYGGKTRKHIKYILDNHPLFDPKDRMIKAYYQGFLPFKTSILNANGLVQASLLQIKSNLTSIETIISNGYIENVVKRISRYINCSDELQIHKKDFDYYARILFSHFYLSEFSRVDIASLIRLVLKGKVIRDGDKIYQEGPLPPDLLEKLVKHNKSNNPFDQALFNEFEAYFTNRNMDDQIKGFLSYAKYGMSDYAFLFKINGMLMYDDILDIDGLQLMDTQKFVEKNNSRITFEDTKSFLYGRSALIKYEVNAHSQDEAVKKAVSELKSKLSRISLITNKNLQLDTSGYLVWLEENGALCLNDLWENNIWTDWDVKMVEDRNNVINSSAHNLFLLNIEKTLAEGYSEVDIHKSLHSYSKFVEQLTKGAMQNISDWNGVPKDIVSIAFLFLLTEEKDYKHLIKLWSYNVIINSQYNSSIGIGLSQEDFAEIRKRRKLIPFVKLCRQIKHDHTLYRIKTAARYSTKSDIKAFHYYIRFLLMLRKNRNISEHLNDGNAVIMRKLKLPINTLLKRVLLLVTKELAKPANANKSSQNVINDLIILGKAKANAIGIVI